MANTALSDHIRRLADCLEREATRGRSLGRMVESPDDWTSATFEYYVGEERWPATAEALEHCRDAISNCPEGLRDRLKLAITNAAGFADTRDDQTISTVLPNIRAIAVELRILSHAMCEEKNSKPTWDNETLELSYQGSLARKYSGQAKNVRTVLDHFELEGWPHRIDDPLSDWKDPARLNETVRSLNSGLQAIRFFAGGDGESFCWEKIS